MIARMNNESVEAEERVERETEAIGNGRPFFADNATERFVFNSEDFNVDMVVDPKNWTG